MGYGLTAHQERTFEIHRNDAPEIGQRGFVKMIEAQDSGHIAQVIETPKRIDTGLHAGPHRILVADIADMGQCPATRLRYQCLARGEILRGNIHAENRGTLGSEAHGHRPADSGSGAGHQRHLVVESFH